MHYKNRLHSREQENEQESRRRAWSSKKNRNNSFVQTVKMIFTVWTKELFREENEFVIIRLKQPRWEHSTWDASHSFLVATRQLRFVSFCDNQSSVRKEWDLGYDITFEHLRNENTTFRQFSIIVFQEVDSRPIDYHAERNISQVQ